jgi:hypothetical protein
LGVVCALQVRATQFLPLSIEEMSRSADVIVRGTVTSRSCARGASGRIVTRVELAVAEVWKGPPRAGITIVQAGGTLGDRCEVVPGQPAYEPGEEVVAFLAINTVGEGATLGVAHGKFLLARDAASESVLAQNNLYGGSGRAAAAKTSRQIAEQGTTQPAKGRAISVAQLRQRVAAATH